MTEFLKNDVMAIAFVLAIALIIIETISLLYSAQYELAIPNLERLVENYSLIKNQLITISLHS